MLKKNLKDYTWGLGIEHEMHIFHAPKNNKDKIKDFILFDSFTPIQNILDQQHTNNKDNITDEDYELLKHIPFEVSGRKCNNQWVIKPVPIKMPELITFHPFCSIRNNRNLKNLVQELLLDKQKLYKILLTNDKVKKLVKKYGDLAEYPYGMTRYLKYPIIEKNNHYIFEKKNGKDLLVPEYNGSYHITITLPHKKNISKQKFIKMHQNFCNQLQWLEPLMLTAYFSGDEDAPGSMHKKTRGSFRVMIIGWGNLAGTDIRLLNKGIGRYSKTPTYWRKDLKFDDTDKLKPCYQPSPSALKEGALSSLSSDFRTFGSTDPLRPEHRESGVSMTVPNGIEFRIFDHFSDFYLPNLVEFIALVAENSNVTKTKGYVYENKIWINALHNIMKNGYKAQLSKSYIELLRKKLGLAIDTPSIIAFDIFNVIFEELVHKNLHGDWMKIFHGNIKTSIKTELLKYPVPEINKKSWQFAFMMKLNTNPILMKKFNILSKCLSNKDIHFDNFQKIVLTILGKNWLEDIVNIADFYNDLPQMKLKLNKNINGTIQSLKFKKLPIIDSFNKEIYVKF